MVLILRIPLTTTVHLFFECLYIIAHKLHTGDYSFIARFFPAEAIASTGPAAEAQGSAGTTSGEAPMAGSTPTVEPTSGPIGDPTGRAASDPTNGAASGPTSGAASGPTSPTPTCKYSMSAPNSFLEIIAY